MFPPPAGAAAGCTEGKHGCVDCYNKWKCQKCADGWLRHPKGYCVPCAGSNGACQECRWYRRTKWCTECSDGFFLKNGKCAPCPKGCSECYNKRGKAFCTACEHGFKRKNGKCVPLTGNPSPTVCPTTPVWRTDTVFGWDPVYGKNSAGACVKCTGGGNHKEWCKACDGDA